MFVICLAVFNNKTVNNMIIFLLNILASFHIHNALGYFYQSKLQTQAVYSLLYMTSYMNIVVAI